MRRYLLHGRDPDLGGDPDDYFFLIEAAKVLNTDATTLMDKPVFWINWANNYQTAVNEARQILIERAGT